MKQITLFIGLLLFVGTQLFAQILEPVKWSFESKQDGLDVTLIFTADIEEEWHLYDTELPDGGPIRTSINFADSSLFEFVGKLTKEPLPTEYFDKIFNMNVGYFSKQAVLTQKIKLKSAEKVDIKGFVEFMSCNDETCTPPTEADFSFSLNDDGSITTENPVNTISSETPNQDDKSGNLLWFLFFSFLAGLAAILTPCVFPMIPMTVSFFMNSGESKFKSRLNALFYGFSIILIYTVIGTLVSVIFGPGIANWLSTHWLPNIIFFADRKSVV